MSSFEFLKFVVRLTCYVDGPEPECGERGCNWPHSRYHSPVSADKPWKVTIGILLISIED